MEARFVLFDLTTRHPVCISELRVENDVSQAPIRSRLQSETRGRLERKLADSLRQKAELATLNVTRHLSWPRLANAQ